jgi:N-acylneuraminate cytidylyltransferase/CMP-N,N'-diacetyllegionaminic acid synthase
MKKKILGIVGIRSGSQGVKDKNIKLFAGKPLVSWILKTAKKSKYINRLVVSTDSNIYSKFAKRFGAEVPYLRPKNLANKNSIEIDFIRHMLNFLKKKQNYVPDIVVRMLATVPMQKTEDIDCVVSHLIRNKNIDTSIVIAEAKQHPLKALRIIKDANNKKNLVSYFDEKTKSIANNSNRLFLPKAYFRANVIATRTEHILKRNSLIGKKIKFKIISQERSIDIDTEIDFQFAEFIFRKNLKKINK